MYSESLPLTGAGVVLFGYTFGLGWLLAIGAVLVAIGIVIVRITSRNARRT